MELRYTTIDGNSKGFFIIIGCLSAMVGGLIISCLFVYIQGQQLWGTSNIIPWGQLITLDIYFIGLSAGAIIISSLCYVFKREEYKPIGRMSVFLGIVLMTGAMLSVLLDLGRPEKFWRLFMYFYMNNMSSIFAINGIFYMGYILLMLVYLWLILENQSEKATIVGTVDVIWAIAVHMGTGAIFGLIGNREIFFSPIKPFEFLAAALSSGTALIILVLVTTFSLTRRKVNPALIISLGRLLALIILVLIVMVFFDKLTHLYFPNREGTVYLITGHYWWLFGIFQIGMGMLLPLILLTYPRTKKTVWGIVLASVFVVLGVLGERAALVIPGTAHPQPVYPGHIEGIWGISGSFPIMLWETLLVFGIVAFVGLFFILGLKYLEILPESESVTPTIVGKDHT